MKDAAILMPASPTHPGEVLGDELAARGIAQSALAQQTGLSQPMISQIIQKKKGISVAVAVKLESALGIPASFWLNLQKRHDQVEEYHRRRREIEKLNLPPATAAKLLAVYG